MTGLRLIYPSNSLRFVHFFAPTKSNKEQHGIQEAIFPYVSFLQDISHTKNVADRIKTEACYELRFLFCQMAQIRQILLVFTLQLTSSNT